MSIQVSVMNESNREQQQTSASHIATRIGIDFGNTIGKVESSEPDAFAFEMIAHIVAKFSPENVFIVSKAKPIMQQNISSWLERAKFYEQTRFLRENLIFVLTNAEKSVVAKALSLSVFFDDCAKVVKSLAPLNEIQRIFWMHADSTSIKQIQPKHLRSKIAITKDWSKTMKYFQRIPRKKEQDAS